jgi:CrcB protein
MSAFVWVGLGGFLGSMARYAVALALAAPEPGRFPFATFSVNLAGCLLIGLLAGIFGRTQDVPEAVRLFLVTGILGGFTTFSAFGLESLQLLRRGDHGLVLLYVAGSVVGGLAAVWLGLRLAGSAPAA